MARLILTTPGEDTPAGGNSDVIGTAAPGEVITLFPGVITLDPSFNLGGDVVVFPEARSAYTIVRDGSNVVIRSDDITITIPFGTAGIELRFADETLVLRVANNQLLIGDQVVTNTEAPIGGESGLVATPIDAGTVSEDGAVVNVNLLSTASDSDGDTLSIGTIISATTNTGRVVEVTRTGSTLSIDPDQFNNLDDGEAETVTVRYTITDGDGTIQNEVTLRVTGADDIPTSGPLFPTDITEDDPPIVINLLSRADDPDGEPVNVGNILTVQTSSGAPLVYTRNGNNITIDPAQFGDDLNEGDTETVTITYTITDGDGLEATNTLTLNIRGVNDGPDAFDDTGTTDENNSLVTGAPGLLGNDVINSPGTTLSVTEVNGVTANVGTTITLASGALLTVNADGSYTYNPNGKFEGLDTGETATETFSYEVSDSNGLSDIGDVTITITGVNDAPVTVVDTFTGNEDTAITGNVITNDTDVDVETLTAVLVSGPANASSFTLNPNGTFSYTPSANFNGSTSFTYKANDGTADGNTVTVTINVNPVNDAPQGTNGSATTLEDTARTFVTGDFGFSDPVEGNAFAGVVITTLPASGQILLNGTPVTAGTFVTAAQITGGQLTFAPAANGNGTPYTNFTFQVRDNGGTANGGQDTDQSANTFTLNVTPVNDPPTSTNLAGDTVNYVENAVPVLLDLGSNATIADIDSANFDTGTLTVAITAGATTTEDVLGISTVGGVTSTATTVSVGGVQIATYTGGTGGTPLVFTFDPDATPAAVQALVRALNYSNSNLLNPSATTRTVSYTLTDGDGGAQTLGPITSSVTVTPINDAPQGTNGSATTLEDTSRIFTAADFGFSDPAEGNAFAGVVITTLPTNGQFLLGGSPITAGTFVTAAQLTANQLVFVPDADENGSPYATFTFQVRDDGGTANGGQDTDQSANTFTINVTPVNDAPTVARLATDSVTYVENATPVLLDNGSNAVVGDIDSANFDTGTLTVAITAGATTTEDVLGISAVGGVTSTATTVSVGGVQIATYTGGTGGAPLVFTFDPDATPAAVQALVRALNYSNSSDNPSGATRTISYTLTDGDGGAGTLGPITSSVAVTPINDAPQGTNGSATTLEDTARTFVTGDFGFSDPVEGNAFAGVVITTLPASGQILLNGTPVTAGTFVTAAQITGGQLTFAPAANGNGTPYTNFTFQVRDNGGTANGGQDTDQSANTFTLNVTPVNDPPALNKLEGDEVFYTEDDLGVALDDGANATVVDIDSPDFATGTLTVSITAGSTSTEDVLFILDNGTASVSGTDVIVSGTTIGTVAGGSSGADLVITFNASATPALIQELVRALAYTNANTTTPATDDRTISYTITDGDGGTSPTITTTVHVAAVNDAPITVLDTYSVNEDGSLTEAAPGVLVNDSDPEGDQIAAELVTGPASASSFTLNPDGSFTYVPTANFNGTDSFVYHATDGDLVGNDVTVTITVNPVNDAPTSTNLAGDSVTYVEDAVPVRLDAGSNATIADIDSANFDTGTLTVAITAGATTTEDVLGISAVGGVTTVGNAVLVGGVQIGTFAGGTGGANLVVTFDNDATPAAVQALVRALNYSNSNSLNPSTAARTLSISLTDGDGGTLTPAVSTTVNVTAVNDAPISTLATPFSGNEDTSFALTGISVADLDGTPGPGDDITVHLSVASGVLNIRTDVAGGITAVDITGGGQGTNGITLTATVAEINATLAALNGLTYTGDLNFFGNDALTVSAYDGTRTDAASLAVGPGTAAGIDPVDVAIADINGDGRLDLVTSAFTDGGIQVRLGNGDGTFGAPTAIAVGAGTNDVEIANINSNVDAFPDLVVTYNGNVRVLLGNGSGGFVAQAPIALSLADAVTAADFNGDGLVDLAVARRDSGSISVLLGNGSGGFGAPTNLAQGPAPIVGGNLTGVAIDTADFNGDGFRDIVVVNQNNSFGTFNGNVQVFFGAAGGTFGAPISFLAGNNPVNVSVADLDGDGDQDMVIAAILTQNVSVVLNNGNGTFAAAVSYGLGANGGDVAVADVNGDGRPDIIATRGAGIATLVGNGNGTFQAAVVAPVGTLPTAVVAGDTDGDGDNDLAIVDQTSDSLYLSQNNTLARGTVSSQVISVLGVNDAPVIGNLQGDTVSYTEEQASPTLLDQGGNATVTDIDSANFDTGTLTVAITAGATTTEDVLGISAVGGVTSTATTVSVGGVQIATYTGGTGGTPLVFTFDPDATPAAVQALVRALNYSNSNLVNPSGTPRTVSYTLTDGDGGTTGAITTTVNVLSINDAPNGTNGSTIILEDTPYALTAANFAFTDPENNGLASVIITTLATNGVLLYDSDPTAGVTLVAVTAGQEISAADIAAGRLTFAPDLNENGTPYATFTFQVRDDGGTANGGVNLDTSAATFTFNVTPVNDQPDAINDTNTTNEDTPVTAATPGVLGNDTDPDVPTTLTVTQVNGVPGNVGVATPVTGGGTVTVASTGGYTYNPNGAFESLGAGASTQVSFTYTASDGALTDDATVTITITGVNDNPTAVADNYTGAPNHADAIGNVTYTSATSVLANDTDVDVYTPTADTLQVTTTTVTNAAGTITFTADGNFTYAPAAGFGGAGAQAVFTYTVTDDHGGSATGTVTIDVAAPVWFIDNSATGSSNVGTQANPFTSIASFNAAQGQPNGPADGEVILLRTGTGTYAEADGINLRDDQVLIGGGDGYTAPTGEVLQVAGTSPVINVTGAGNNGVTLGEDNAVRGLDFNMAAGTDAAIEDDGTSVGTLTISNVAVAGAAQIIDIDNGGTISVTLDSATSTGGAAAGGVIDIENAGGSFTVTGATTITNATQVGVFTQNPTSALNLTFQGAVAISSGANRAFDIGDSEAATNLRIENGLDIDTTSGTGLDMFNGTLTVLNIGATSNTIDTTAGKLASLTTVTIGAEGASFDSLNATGTVSGDAVLLNGIGGAGTFNGGTVSIAGTSGAGPTADGIRIIGAVTTTVNFGATTIGALSGTTGDGIDIGNTGTGAITFASVTINGSGESGVEINSTSVVAINGGSIGASNDPAGIGVDINGGSADITISASITGTTAGSDVIEVSGRTGGTVDFNGLITSTNGGGIDLNTNTAGAVRFDGGMTIAVTGSTVAFNSSNAAGSTATLVVTDPGGVGVAPANVLSSATGAALNVVNTTIGAEDLTFQSISANGAVNGIVLNNTGTSGGLIITGDSGSAVNSSGGTIQNTTGAGIVLTNTRDVLLDQVNVQNTGNDGIDGTSVTNFSLTNSTVAGAGDSANEYGVLLTDLFGTGTINNTSVTNSQTNNLRVVNSSATAGTLTVSNSTFTTTDAVNGGDAVSVETANNGNLTVNLSINNDLNNSQGDGIQATSNQASTLRITVDGTDSNYNGNLGSAVNIAASGTSQLYALVQDLSNVSTGTNGVNGLNVINIQNFDTSTINATVQNNTITGLGNNVSGIRIIQEGNGTITADIGGNNISGITANGIVAQARAGTGAGGQLNLTIHNNVVNLTSALALDGISIRSGSSAGTDVNTVRLDLDNNNSAATAASQQGYRLQNGSGGGTVFQLETYAGGATDAAAVTTWINTTGSNTGSTDIQVGLNGFTNVGAVPLPTLPLLAASAPAAGATASAVSAGEVATLLDAAIARWADAGATDAQLAAMRATGVVIADLGGLALGGSTPGQIVIDDDAAGHGWFVDATPLDDSEFAGAGGPAEGHMDLLTALMHELGHQIGLEHDDSGADDVMAGYLDAGDRNLPYADGAGSAAGGGAKNGTGGDLARPESIASEPGAGKAHRLDGGGFGHADMAKATVPSVLSGASQDFALADNLVTARLDAAQHCGFGTLFALAEMNLT